MKILVVGLNYAPEITSTGKYTGEMAEWFSKQGHHVKVVTTPPYYPQWSVQKPYKAYAYIKEELNGVSVYRCPLYVPSKVGTLTRIVHLLSFALSSFPVLLRMVFWRPDVVINPVPSLFSSPGSALVAKICGATSVLHVQDFEVEAMLGLGMAKGGIISKLARIFERWVLSLFSKVSTISNSMKEKAIEKGIPRGDVIFFPNWSDIAHFQKEKDPESVRLRFGVPGGKKLVLYSGNIGDKQGLEQVIDAVEALKDEAYFFVIVGEGAGKENLLNLAEEKNLKNINFCPLQPFELLPSVLFAADCHLVVQKKGVADAVLPSKLTNILAVGGNAVITAEEETELGVICRTNKGIAELVEPECLTALIDGIKSCCAKQKPNQVAIDYAKNNIDKNSVLARFESDIVNIRQGA